MGLMVSFISVDSGNGTNCGTLVKAVTVNAKLILMLHTVGRAGRVDILALH